MIIWDIKLSYNWECLAGTTWELGEHYEDIMGTHWEQGKKIQKKTNSSYPLLLAPKNKTGPLLNFGLEFAWEFWSRRMNHGGVYSPINNHKWPKISSQMKKRRLSIPSNNNVSSLWPTLPLLEKFHPKKRCSEI
jgi:hypothetical protein